MLEHATRSPAAESQSLRSYLDSLPTEDVIRISDSIDIDYHPTALVLEFENRRQTPVVRQFEQQSKKLESDFYSWDDGQYRDGVIKPAWDKKREELETARKDLEQAEKDLAELPEKARKAGALPGWLRE